MGATAKRCILLLTVLLGGCAATLAEVAPTGPAAEIERLEREFGEALKRADWDAVERILHEDYYGTGGTGKTATRSDLVGRLRTGETRYEAYDLSEFRVRFLGDIAISNGKRAVKRLRKDEVLVADFRFTNIWVRENGQWREIAHHAS